MKRKIPPAVISLIIGMLIPLIMNVVFSLSMFSHPIGELYYELLFLLIAVVIFGGLPSLLISTIANYFFMKFKISDRTILSASITIGIVIGIIAIIPVAFFGFGQ